MGKKLRVHFMGIGGSGMVPTAIIAKKMGFDVSGCDISNPSYYSNALVTNGISVQTGHGQHHLQDIDILAVTPAVFDVNPNHPEIIEGCKKKILLTWQQFAGKYLHKDKFLISIAGTHGKSTTTVLMGLVLEAGGLNPIVEAGAVYKPWGGGYRVANSSYFVCEADEFNCNFLNFSPSLAIINNVEMDHPEFFKSFESVKQAFKNFIKNLKYPKILVVNEESNGLREILQEMKDWLKEKDIKIIGYYLNDRLNCPFREEYRGEIKTMNSKGTVFNVYSRSWSDSFKLGTPGIYNVANSLGVLSAALELRVTIDTVKSVFKDFNGIDRRFELIGEHKGIKVYNDYAHHPTAVAAVIEAFRMIYQGKKIWAIIEPHQISRLRLFVNEFADALNKADQVIITKTFLGREIHKNIKSLEIEILINKINKDKARYIESFKSVSEYATSHAKPGDIIVIFGAGNSYKLARNITRSLKMECLNNL